jgi:transmembrane sensor
MQPSNAYYKELLAGFISNSLTEEQGRELFSFIEQNPGAYTQLMNEEEIIALISENAAQRQETLSPVADERIRKHLISRKIVKMRFRNIAAAAAVLLLIGAGTLLFLNNRHTQPVRTVSADIAAPASNRATITLANGTVVSVDSLQKGVQAGLSTKIVSHHDGQIVYEKAGTEGQTAYNTLNNPRGSKIVDIVLSDHSHVWLNAGSSITYPVAFTGNERNVRVKGEAYFEVAPDAHKPFLVSKDDLTIEVLGTHFNINAYNNATKTTLLEGAVRVKKGSQQVVLQPGQQAQADASINVISDVNVSQAVAWKNGFFNFENMRLPEVMQQLEIWYDITVEYQGSAPDVRFFGELRRDTNLSGVIAALQDSGVKFKVEGNKLIVLPQ